MARPKKIDRPERLVINIPASIHARVQLELYSQLEGRVPYGATSDLVSQLLTQWLDSRGVSTHG